MDRLLTGVLLGALAAAAGTVAAWSWHGDLIEIPGERSAERGLSKSSAIEADDLGFDTKRRSGAPGISYTLVSP